MQERAISRQVIVGWPVEQGLRWETDTVVRDDELTGNADSHNASVGLSNTIAVEDVKEWEVFRVRSLFSAAK